MKAILIFPHMESICHFFPLNNSAFVKKKKKNLDTTILEIVTHVNIGETGDYDSTEPAKEAVLLPSFGCSSVCHVQVN